MTEPVVAIGLVVLAVLAWIALSAAASIMVGDWLLARGASIAAAERAELIAWALATLAGIVVAVLVAAS